MLAINQPPIANDDSDIGGGGASLDGWIGSVQFRSRTTPTTPSPRRRRKFSCPRSPPPPSRRRRRKRRRSCFGRVQSQGWGWWGRPAGGPGRAVGQRRPAGKGVRDSCSPGLTFPFGAASASSEDDGVLFAQFPLLHVCCVAAAFYSPPVRDHNNQQAG